eukprot:gnl/TRDRNA2_/TRDRNA2_28765_c0_seq1.p1 gnl/TRDRNA2_/TRDRNA2_28765_c0~~gnl/TRDRNA2_/TRDRNA2_28765_c0_seq1.p1  ORF type:complete len:396 (-),score=61.54 gnl/TRDRNA2_/TRDRNA2_28765_c0_seq1:66-1175(-)
MGSIAVESLFAEETKATESNTSHSVSSIFVPVDSSRNRRAQMVSSTMPTSSCKPIGKAEGGYQMPVPCFLPTGRCDEDGGWGMICLQEHLGSDAPFLEWQWAWMQIRKFDIEFWMQRPDDPAVPDWQRAAAWYDIRDVATVRCERALENAESGKCIHELSVAMRSGSFTVRFEEAAEQQRWQCRILTFIREIKKISPGERVKALSVLWLDLLKHQDASCSSHHQLLEELFSKLDADNTGSVPIAEVAQLCMQSFEHRRLLLLQYDCEANGSSTGALDAGNGIASVKLLDEYDRRMLEGSLKKCEGKIRLVCEGKSDVMNLQEFKRVSGMLLFPTQLLALEWAVWIRPWQPPVAAQVSQNLRAGEQRSTL